MRKHLAFLLSLVILAEGCASGGSRPYGSTAAAPRAAEPLPSFDAVNRALADEQATIELADGSVVRDVESVVMTPESTSWRLDNAEHTVPTAQVRKVTRMARWRAAKGLAAGAIVGLLVGAAVAGTYSSKHPGEKLLLFTFVDAMCGLAGLVGAVVMRTPADRVVYVAPAPGAALNLENHSDEPAGHLHCHLAAGSPGRGRAGTGGLDCGPKRGP